MIWRLAVIGFVAGLAGLVGVWVGDRDAPTIQLSADLVHPIGQQGSRILIHEVIERRKLCALQVERIMVDFAKIRYVLEDLVFTAPPGGFGRDEYVTPVPIPVQMEIGPAKLMIHKIYRCNPFHWFWPIVADGMDFEFHVVAGPDYQRVDPIPNTK